MTEDVLDRFDSYEAADEVRFKAFIQEQLIVGYVKDLRTRAAPPLLVSTPVELGERLPRDVAEAFVLYVNAVRRRRAHRTYRMMITAPSDKVRCFGVIPDEGTRTVLATLVGTERQLTSSCIAELRSGSTKLGELEQLTPVQAVLFLYDYFDWVDVELVSTYPKSEDAFRLCVAATNYGCYMRTKDDRE